MKKLKTYILQHFEVTLVLLIFIGILAIAFLVHYKFSFLNFFFLPVILAGYFLSRRQAVLSSFFCILVIVLYLIFSRILFGTKQGVTIDEIINLVTWGSFLILTGAIIGTVSEQRESRLKNLKRAYIGVLEIMLKYLEVADKEKPRSLRVSQLAGEIAQAAGLPKRDVENIKSAALLYDAGDLQTNLPLFKEVANFIGKGIKFPEERLSDRDQVMLKTTASLLKEVEPILVGYFHFYVEEKGLMDKDLDNIPLGSSIIALADLYDRISTGLAPSRIKGVNSLADIEKLADRVFPASIIGALQSVVYSA
ncbi:MAG: hypothetical protein ACE5GI_03540 [Candidatus Aminicenantales bacterium]